MLLEERRWVLDDQVLGYNPGRMTGVTLHSSGFRVERGTSCHSRKAAGSLTISAGSNAALFRVCDLDSFVLIWFGEGWPVETTAIRWSGPRPASAPRPNTVHCSRGSGTSTLNHSALCLSWGGGSIGVLPPPTHHAAGSLTISTGSNAALVRFCGFDWFVLI